MFACLSSLSSEISRIAVHGAPSSKSSRISEFYCAKYRENCGYFTFQSNPVSSQR